MPKLIHWYSLRRHCKGIELEDARAKRERKRKIQISSKEIELATPTTSITGHDGTF